MIKYLPSILFLFLFLNGCSATRPLFQISDANNPTLRNYTYTIENDSVKVKLEGSFDYKHRAEFIIRITNKTPSDFLINFDRKNIWVKSHCNHKASLREIFVVDGGYNIDSVTLHSNEQRYIKLSFEAHQTYSYDVSKEKLVFPLNLEGFVLKENSGAQIDLFNKFIIFARTN